MKKALIVMLMLLLAISSVAATFIVIRPSDIREAEPLIVKVINNEDKKIDDAQASVYVPDAAYYRSSTGFDVKSGDSRTEFFWTEDLEPGYYPVRVAVLGDGVRKVKWTWVYVE